jgi:hypothetical protein
MAYPDIKKIDRADVFEVWRQKLNVYHDMLSYTKNSILGGDNIDLKTSSKAVIPAINELLNITQEINTLLGDLAHLPYWNTDLAQSLFDEYSSNQRKIGDIYGVERLTVRQRNGTLVTNLSAAIIRLDAMIGPVTTIYTNNNNSAAEAINELCNLLSNKTNLITENSTVIPAINEIYDILGTTVQSEIATGLPPTIVSSVNNINERLIVTNERSIENKNDIAINAANIARNLAHLEDIDRQIIDINRRIGDIAVLTTPVRTSVAAALESLNRIAIRKTDKWHVINSEQSRELGPTKGGIDKSGNTAPAFPTAGLSLSQLGSDKYETGVSGLHVTWHDSGNMGRGYIGLGNINDETDIPSENVIDFTKDTVNVNRNTYVSGLFSATINGVNITLSSMGVTEFNINTTSNMFSFNKKLFAADTIGIKDSKTSFNASGYTEDGVSLYSKYQPRAEDINPRRVTGYKLWYPTGETSDNVFTYTPTPANINGHTTQNFLDIAPSGGGYTNTSSSVFTAFSYVQSPSYFVGGYKQNGSLAIDSSKNAFLNRLTLESDINLNNAGRILGTSGGQSYEFSLSGSSYNFNTTTTHFTFNKEIAAPAFSSGSTWLNSNGVVEKGVSLEAKYFGKTERLDGVRVSGPYVWTPVNGNPVFSYSQNTTVGESVLTVCDSFGQYTYGKTRLVTGTIDLSGYAKTQLGYKVKDRIVIDDNGNIYGGQTVSSSSDSRLKTNINSLNAEDAKRIVETIQPVTYDFIDGSKNRYGFIAQEVRDILPSIVTEDKDGMLGISYNDLIAVLVKTVQDLSKEVDALKNK